MTELALSITGLRKSYGDLVAVDDVTFQVRRGEIFGLLGPNGAGKTTTLECIEGLREPDAGTLRVLDIDPTREQRRLNRVIGVQLQSSGMPPSMTVAEASRFFAAYHGVKPRFDLLERLGLAEKSASQHHQLSTGQQRRLALALAVAHEPPVVFLDEPTAGLDVASRVELHDLVRELKDKGATIVLSTHDMAEAEKMTDRVAILLHGRITATGTPRELTATGSGLTKVSVRTENSSLHQNPHPFPAVETQLVRDEYAVYYTRDPGPVVTAVLEAIIGQGDRLIDLRVERPTLEERFLEITSHGEIA
jgi:ABC-2 type transport system ATP-binding protein